MVLASYCYLMLIYKKIFRNYSQSSMSSLEPWKLENDTDERNLKAKEAYTAMLTVTTMTPEDEKYLNFSTKVIQMILF